MIVKLNRQSRVFIAVVIYIRDFNPHQSRTGIFIGCHFDVQRSTVCIQFLFIAEVHKRRIVFFHGDAEPTGTCVAIQVISDERYNRISDGEKVARIGRTDHIIIVAVGRSGQSELHILPAIERVAGDDRTGRTSQRRRHIIYYVQGLGKHRRIAVRVCKRPCQFVGSHITRFGRQLVQCPGGMERFCFKRRAVVFCIRCVLRLDGAAVANHLIGLAFADHWRKVVYDRDVCHASAGVVVPVGHEECYREGAYIAAIKELRHLIVREGKAIRIARIQRVVVAVVGRAIVQIFW